MDFHLACYFPNYLLWNTKNVLGGKAGAEGRGAEDNRVPEHLIRAPSEASADIFFVWERGAELGHQLSSYGSWAAPKDSVPDTGSWYICFSVL